MNDELKTIIMQLNPWISNKNELKTHISLGINREQAEYLLSPDWDHLWLILTGPRQAGKTTLGKYLCQQIILEGRYENLVYLNCDFIQIRTWLTSTKFLKDISENFDLDKPYILFIDEVQRLESPGLFLKTIIDLKLNIKLVTSGSSQLEMKSKVSEFLTGRKMEATILPLSIREASFSPENLIYGTYPDVYKAKNKIAIATELFNTYIQKDIIEILKMQKPDVVNKLITLLAHSAGQLINYNQLASDCKVSSVTIKNYIHILEQTFVIKTITPFVGNKRKEITSNPVTYFIDNGFRNIALKNFNELANRTDTGLLVESMVFSEILKWVNSNKNMVNIHYWRTQSGAEVDFVLVFPGGKLVPIEVKYRNMAQASLTRSFHSFIDAYKIEQGFFITKDFNGTLETNNTKIKYISLKSIKTLFEYLDTMLV